VALRESLRFERTRIFGFVRELFRAFGRRYAESGALASPQDVFLLTVDEILGFVRGTTPTTDLRGLVEVRRREFDAFHAGEAPAERFHTWGAVHVANRFRGRPRPALAAGDVLEGTPCAPGRVVATARVVADPRDTPDLGGAILVAHRTDPGWVPLYPTASGLLVERGSLLSHSAVVARELGLPAIIGVRGLLDWVRDGETLAMDGGTGRIDRPRADEAAGG
jgi:pyruvate,water dikinase